MEFLILDLHLFITILVTKMDNVIHGMPEILIGIYTIRGKAKFENISAQLRATKFVRLFRNCHYVIRPIFCHKWTLGTL